jgi:preprotein translocase subunit YajC
MNDNMTKFRFEVHYATDAMQRAQKLMEQFDLGEGIVVIHDTFTFSSSDPQASAQKAKENLINAIEQLGNKVYKIEGGIVE